MANPEATAENPPFADADVAILEATQNAEEARLMANARDLALVFESVWERQRFADKVLGEPSAVLVDVRRRLETLPPLGEHGHSDEIVRARIESLADRRRICKDWRATLEIAKAELQIVRVKLREVERQLKEKTGVDAMAVSQREFTRVRVLCPCEFTTEKESFTGNVVNLGIGGLFISTPDLLPSGSGVGLRFKLPNGRYIRALGTVRWFRDPWDQDNEPGIGVELTAVPDEDGQALRAFIDEHAQLVPAM